MIRRTRSSAHALLSACLAVIVLGLLELGCSGGDPRPNILWVVWDTVRADHMSLYGYPKPTTPRLDEWAKRSRIFDDALSASNSTVPSHASMFTGLVPTQHGAHSGHRWLDDAHTTAAELLRDAGYQTYLFAANPHISVEENFAQGFEVVEHPWSPRYRKRATEIVMSKIHPDDVSSELTLLARRFGQLELNKWGSKASGALAREGLENWLATSEAGRPWFALLNYMEAHRPFLPSAEHRARIMSASEVERSYRIDRSWPALWGYFFGVESYSEEELQIMAATYDATLAELDDLFADLLDSLERGGWLENTVVFLVSDHGEHLGEHRMLDHQYSLYQGLVHVPLVVYAPGRVEPGHDTRPVMNLDLFPTVHELAGIEGHDSVHARSLLSPNEQRRRLSEYPSATPEPLELVQRRHPDFDPTPWLRSLRAWYDGDYKLIRGSDGRRELYDLAQDPDEERDLAGREQARLTALDTDLDALVQGLARPRTTDAAPEEAKGERREMLEALGYLAPQTSPTP
jgi:arylsulfatase A-like enzyme